MKDDERLDSSIRELAGGLNVPPPTPRDEIWARIQAERARRPRKLEAGTGRLRWVVRTVGVAATLALGVALGRLSMRGGTSTPVAAAPDTASVPSGESAAYQVAATEHLGRVETFLTVFNADAPTEMARASDFEAPARQLLLRTRLLRQSPAAANDATLRALLDDVELILLQIASFARAGDARELDFVEQGINERSVMLRLRSAAPAASQWRNTGGAL
jgi:hypothetical protein